MSVLIDGHGTSRIPLSSYRYEGFIHPEAYVSGIHIISMSGPWTESESEVIEALAWFRGNRSRHRAVVRRKANRFRVGSLWDAPSRAPAYFRGVAMDIRLWLDRLRVAGLELAGSYLNLGANDGVSSDPLHPLAVGEVRELGGASLAIEADPALCVRHRKNLPWVPLACTRITTSNARAVIAPSFRTESSRAAVDVVKVDIDSFEGPMLEECLWRLHLRPKLLMVEVNSGIPPPLQFALLDSPQLRRHLAKVELLKEGGQPLEVNLPVAGVSLSYLVRRLAPDYALLELGSPDAIFVRSDLLALLGRKPLDEFEAFGRSWADAHGFSRSQIRRWHFELDEVDALGEVHAYLTSWMERHLAEVLPFTLTY